MRRWGLGYISTIAIATGGPTNPVGIAVTIAAGAALVVSRFLHVGAGRTEADYLTDPATGAQTHAGAALDGVTAEFWNHPESWTPEHIDAVVSALQKIGTDFETYAQQFPRAGPGGVRTIWYWVNRAIGDIRSVSPITNESESGLDDKSSRTLPPLEPRYLDTPSPVAPSFNPLWLLGLLLLGFRRKR